MKSFFNFSKVSIIVFLVQAVINISSSYAEQCFKRVEMTICASRWSFTKNHYMMHGPQNIKFCNAKQAKQIYKYKNIKTKLYKNNAAIWCKKTCRLKQIKNCTSHWSFTKNKPDEFYELI